MPELKEIALKIASLLPRDRETAEQVLGLVEDLMDWRGYSPELVSPCANDSNRLGSEDTSPQ